MSASNPIPLVSVCTIAYNREKFITQAIESVLMQQTTFAYELVIGEDCSTDGTRAIVADYQQRYPDKIRAVFHEKNLGIHKNYAVTITACRGKYIAFLDADDYWTDPLKLQKQVDYLEAHPEYSGSAHRSEVVDENGERTHLYPCYFEKHDLNLADSIAISSPWQTSCFLCRRALLVLPAWDYSLTGFDLLVFMVIASKGKIRFFPEIMSAYRCYPGGATSSAKFADQLHLSYLKVMDRFDDYLQGRCHDKIDYVRAYHRRRILSRLIEQGDFRAAHVHAKELLGYNLRHCCFDDSGRLLRIIFRGSCPRLWQLVHKSKNAVFPSPIPPA